ncbi:MAG: reverse transcriptase domain-containing protein [Nitrospirae bacterium]|nr:reverse transcriptase domain-containing protein [Nitrospirota bacterium]
MASPTAANVALDGLEKILKQEFAQKDKVKLVRYADDFVITGASKELLEKNVRPLVEEFLKERGLELSEEKTRIVHITEGFVFLGQEVRKYDGKLLITPSKKNVKHFLSKVRDIIGKSKATRQEELIDTLNPLIRGWANFHRHIVAKKTYGWIDHHIHQMLWGWARRRHPNKGERWVKKKYFPKRGSREWVFTPASGTGPTLIKASDTPIRRHVKIISQAHPFDPQWTSYFEERKRKPTFRETVKKKIQAVKAFFGFPDTPEK